MDTICLKTNWSNNAILYNLHKPSYKLRPNLGSKPSAIFIHSIAAPDAPLPKLSKQAVIDSNKFSSKVFADSVLKVYRRAIDNRLENTSFLERLVDKVKESNKNEDK